MNKYCNNIITKLTKPKVTVVKKNEEIFISFLSLVVYLVIYLMHWKPF